MKKTLTNLKPFLSVFFILATLFSVVFVRMENRRMGYEIYDLAEKEKHETQKQRVALLNLARMTSPERVRKLATERLTFQSAKEGQVIRVTNSGGAVIR
jgi:cell division protein FtsL